MKKKQGRKLILFFVIMVMIPLCFSACSKKQKEEKKHGNFYGNS